MAFVLLAAFAAVQYPAAQAERERRSPIYRAEDWVRIEPGEFCMGSHAEGDAPEACPAVSPDAEAQADEQPLHRVRIAKAFLLGKYEVTFAEYDRFVYDNLETGMRLPSDSGFGADLGPEQRQRLPVINVSWHDARDYAAWLSERTGKRFRLPTEAEWEYAARAGTVTPRPWAGGLEAACGHANVFDRKHRAELEARFGSINWDNFPCEDAYATTAPAGSFTPNALCSVMCGNGSRTATMKTIRERLPTAPLGRRRIAPGAWSVAVPGATLRGACARPPAAGSGRTTGTATWGFVSPSPPAQASAVPGAASFTDGAGVVRGCP